MALDTLPTQLVQGPIIGPENSSTLSIRQMPMENAGEHGSVLLSSIQDSSKKVTDTGPRAEQNSTIVFKLQSHLCAKFPDEFSSVATRDNLMTCTLQEIEEFSDIVSSTDYSEILSSRLRALQAAFLTESANHTETRETLANLLRKLEILEKELFCQKKQTKVALEANNSLRRDLVVLNETVAAQKTFLNSKEKKMKELKKKLSSDFEKYDNEREEFKKAEAEMQNQLNLAGKQILLWKTKCVTNDGTEAWKAKYETTVSNLKRGIDTVKTKTGNLKQQLGKKITTKNKKDLVVSLELLETFEDAITDILDTLANAVN